jgi:hypothetical protein
MNFHDLTIPPFSLGHPPQPRGAFAEGDYKPGERVWINDEPFQVWLDADTLLQVLPGFESDGASVPRVFFPLCGPYERHTFPAAFAHDALYLGELVSRHEADRAFYRLLRRGGAAKAKAAVMFSAVVAFGWAVWCRHSREQVEQARLFARVVRP